MGQNSGKFSSTVSGAQHISDNKLNVCDFGFHRAVLPILAFAVALFLGFAAWSYASDTDVREAMNIVLSSRKDLIFDTVDISALKTSNVRLNVFIGDQAAFYRRLAPLVPDKALIFTGYTDENGYPLFGGFSATYDITTGKLFYNCFEGLYTLDAGSDFFHIPPKECANYAPAVLALYRLNTFDTPFF